MNIGSNSDSVILKSSVLKVSHDTGAIGFPPVEPPNNDRDMPYFWTQEYEHRIAYLQLSIDRVIGNRTPRLIVWSLAVRHIWSYDQSPETKIYHTIGRRTE